MTSIPTQTNDKGIGFLPRVDGSAQELATAAPAPIPRRAPGLRTRTLRHPSTPILFDSTLLVAVFMGVTWLAPMGTLNPLLVAIISAAVTVLVARSMGLYSVAAADSHAVAWKRSFIALMVCVGVFLLVAYVTSVAHDRAWLPLATAGALLVFSLHRLIVFVLTTHGRTRSRFATRVALLGDASAISEFDKMESKDARRVVVERTSLDSYDDIRPALRQVDELIDLVHAGEVDRVVVLATAPGIPVVNAVVRRCSMRGVGVDLLTGANAVRASRLEMGRMHGFSTVHIRSGLHGLCSLAVKRVFDLVVASFALVALSPVMAVAAIAVKAGSRGPVFYKQRRLGRRGQQFEMIKFRSMVADAEKLLVDLTDQNEADGPLFKMKNDPRITRVGRFIRRTSIDELPQLWNVLRGQMSLVGPRPALAIEADGWPIELFDRLEVSPGITGLWQVKGRSDASFADYERLDLYYVDNWTLGLDVAILARTIPALLGRGAY